MSTAIINGASQKNVESLAGSPSPLLLLHAAVLGDLELHSVGIETNRGLDPSNAAPIVEHYRRMGWSFLHISPRPDGFTAVVAPSRDITPAHREALEQVVQYDRTAPLKKVLKRDAFLTPGEHAFFIDTETVHADGWELELPYGPFRVRYEPSSNQSNDGHAAIQRSAAEHLVATSLIRSTPKRRSPLARARRILKDATHLQTFFVGAHGSSKGLHVIRDDEDFQRQFGSGCQAVSDAENLKGEMWFSPGHFTGKLNVWRPRGRRSAVLTASEDLRRRLNTDVLGREQTASLHTAAIQRAYAETLERIANGQPFTHEEELFPSWAQEVYQERRLYASNEERQVASAFPWTGSIHPKLYGGIGAFTSDPGSRVPIQGIMCILGGNGRYYGLPQPAPGYVGFATDGNGRPHSALLNAGDYPRVSFTLDTADHDGDLVLVVPARDPECHLSPDPDTLWAMVLRTPASPGGIAWLRLSPEDWKRLLDAGAMPVTVNGPVPYREYMLPDATGQLPVHTLRPIGDSRRAQAWDTDPQQQVKEAINIRNQAALIGVFYRVMTAAHNADALHLPVPQWLEDLYAEHGMEPSTTGGSSTCFSEYVDSQGKLLTPPIEAMAEVLCSAVAEHGVRLDACIKQSLWQPMFDAFSRTTSWDNRQIAAALNRAFSKHCMGDHWRATRSLESASAWFNQQFVKLQLMSNGPAALLLAGPDTFPGELVALISAAQDRISRLWANKFAGDREIDTQTRTADEDDPDDESYPSAQQDPEYESWELLSTRQAAQQKAAAYRRTADQVARLIAADIVQTAELGYAPVSYVSAWIRLNALSANRFGTTRNGYRQPPQPVNTTTLFRALSLLEREQPDLASQATGGFAQQWPGDGPTALVRLSDPEAIVPGERCEIRLNSNTGQYLLCRKASEPVCRVTAGGAHFANLPLTFAGNPQPLDPTGDSKEQQGLSLFLVNDVQPQTVSLPAADTPDDFVKDEEVIIERESSASGPVYYLATSREHLERSLKAGRQASFNRLRLDGVHELQLGRKFRYAGVATNGNVLLRSEFRRTTRSERLVDSILDMALTAAS